MEQLEFERIRTHIGHHIVAVQYGKPPVNATIECETCGMVIYSADPATRVRTRPVEMWQFALLNGGTVEQQVLAGLELENEITVYATVTTAKALGIALAELSGDQDDAWSEMLEAAHEHASYAVSLEKVTVLQFGDDVPHILPALPAPILTRPVEVFRLWPAAEGGVGRWNTAFVEVPRDTPEHEIAAVAVERHHAELVMRREAVVNVGFYNLPPLPGTVVPEGVDVDAYTTFGWVYDDGSRARMLEGARWQMGDFVSILGQYTWPLVALQLNVNEEVENIVEEWTSLSRDDKVETIGRWLAALAVKKRMETVAELRKAMPAAEIGRLVLTPVLDAMLRVAQERT